MTKQEAMKILGLKQGFTDKEREKAFKKLSKTCHPDLYKGDEEKCEEFKKLNEANQILSGKIQSDETKTQQTRGDSSSSSQSASTSNHGFSHGMTCPKCFGTGKMKKRKMKTFGAVDVIVECDMCGGKGIL